MTLYTDQLQEALERLGHRLQAEGAKGPIRLYLVGGSAGLLAGLLAPSRSTADVDVMDIDPPAAWSEVRKAAAEVAIELNLPKSWVNNDCHIHLWLLPLDWRARAQQRGDGQPLEIWLLSRKDFIAAKVVSAPRRPQDLEDIKDTKPTAEELEFAEENIDRLQAEHLNPDDTFDDARAILEAIRDELADDGPGHPR